jgi:hypothetical protein
MLDAAGDAIGHVIIDDSLGIIGGQSAAKALEVLNRRQGRSKWTVNPHTRVPE